MTIKGPSPNMKHADRVHRVHLDWLFERFREDPEISIRRVDTKRQVADFLTKGHFTSEEWTALMRLSKTGKPHALLAASALTEPVKNKRKHKCCGIGPGVGTAGGDSSHVERSTCQETSAFLRSFLSYHFVRRPNVISLVTIPRVNQDSRRLFLCPRALRARQQRSLESYKFDTMVMGMNKSCKRRSSPQYLHPSASSSGAGGDSSRSRGGSGSHWPSPAQLIVNSWIVGLATLFKPLAELARDKHQEVSAANYKHTTLPESAKLFKNNLLEFEKSPHFKYEDLDMLLEQVLSPLQNEAGGDSTHEIELTE